MITRLMLGPATGGLAPAAQRQQRFKLRCAPLTHSNTCYTPSVILGLGVSPMRRREFITIVGGAAALPLAAWAQQRERMRRIGVLMNTAADDPEGQARVAAFLQGLQQWGWAVGGNVQIDIRFSADDAV